MIDTHAHLDFPEFAEDFEEVRKRAAEVGVKQIINIGVDLKSSYKAVEFAKRYPEMFAAIGFHPHDAKHYNKKVEEELRELANNFKVVAIGEIGLDFYRDHSPRDIQRRVFVKQIQLAKSLGLPMVIHIRNAYAEALDILAAEKAWEVGVVLHCFSGNREEAFRALDLGFLLSFGGVLTFKNSRLPELVAEVPLESVILETDCPFLAPHPYRGQRNHPALVQMVYMKLAEILGRKFDEVEAQIDKNAENFFEFA
ncbi:MAG: TatD family hydrolase [bacterium]